MSQVLLRKQVISKEERERLSSLFKYEKKAFSEGFLQVVGIDEAGRGPLAGPVVAAACMLPNNLVHFPYLNDSKQLSEEKRESLFETLISHPHVKIGVGIVSHQLIDEINILQATLVAMRIAVENLPLSPDLLLIDGIHPLPPYPTWTIIGGDALSLSVAAASVIAKVTRDRLMEELHQMWPHYRFDKHKGYGTKGHLEALKTHGPCPIHRKTFAPVKTSLENWQETTDHVNLKL